MYGYITCCLSILQLMDIWIVSTVWLLWIMLLWTFAYRFFVNRCFQFLCIYLGVELWSCGSYLNFEELLACFLFSKVLDHFFPLICMSADKIILCFLFKYHWICWRIVFLKKKERMLYFLYTMEHVTTIYISSTT